MTISKCKKITSATVAATALTFTVGCGGSGGGGSSAQGTPFPTGIYVAGNKEHRIRRFDGMDGSGHLTYSSSDSNFPTKIAFDTQGRLLTNAGLTALTYWNGSSSGPSYYGSLGDGVGQFNQITGIGVDSEGKVYLADVGNQRLARINSVSGGGWTTLDFSALNPSHGSVSVALDASNRIYLLFKNDNKLVRFDSMSDSSPEVLGGFGPGSSQFKSPSDVQVDDAGHIYVADSGNYRVVRFDDMAGSGWTAYGSQGAGTGQFNGPIGIAVDGVGRIYVTDDKNYRVVRIDDMSGSGWISFGSQGSGDNQFTSMHDILVR